MELNKLSAAQLAQKIRAREVSAEEATTDALRQIAAQDSAINAFLATDEDGALAAARRVDEKLATGEEMGPLAGVPVGIKDNICTKGLATTCASRMLQNFVPPYDASVVRKLRGAGCVPVGKLNMDEFAMGSSCENSFFGPAKNPWDTSRVPGGSSGGSAAAVAACEVPLTLGSDTGGSIRTPAAFCGVVGLKPTYGAVSRYGLVAFASSLDQIGPLGRTVEDVALLFGAICGEDRAHDATSKDCGFTGALEDKRTAEGLRIGIPKEYFEQDIGDEVRVAVEEGVRLLQLQGAQLVEISLPSTRYALAAYYIISSAEASSNLARYDGVKYGFSKGREGGLEALYETTRSEGFGAEVQRRILLGTHVLSSGYYDAYYKRAKLMQRQIVAEFETAFRSCDILAAPTTPFTAFKLGERCHSPTEMYAADVCTVPVNIAGLPAVSLPCGTDAAGLPIGMQLIGRRFGEAALLQAARCYEAAVGGFRVKGAMV